jgi:hypothetical protein
MRLRHQADTTRNFCELILLRKKMIKGCSARQNGLKKRSVHVST